MIVIFLQNNVSLNSTGFSWLYKRGFFGLFVFMLSFVSVVKAQDFSKQDKALLREAFKEFSREDFSKARAIYTDLIKRYPDDFEINYYLGACFLNTRYQKTEAIPYLKKAVEKGESAIPPIVHKDLGDLYHIDYQFDKAIYHYQQFLSLADKDDEFIDVVKRKIEICYNASQLINDTLSVRIRRLRKPVNSDDSEYAPLISADDSILFFTSRKFYTDEELLLVENPDTAEKVFVSFQWEGEWSVPKQLHFTGIDEDYGVSLAGLSPDGQTLFLNVLFDGQSDIYSGSYYGEDTLQLFALPLPINSEYNEGKVSVSADGATLWFSSDRPGGLGGRDLYKICKLNDEAWGALENPGSPINTKYDEDAPYLHPGNSILYFSSKGNNTMGGYDIFSVMFDNGITLFPVNMGFPINTTADDQYFMLTANGKVGYFSSAHNNRYGNHDIYQVYTNLNIPLTVVKGTILAGNPLQPIPAKLRVRDNKTGEKLRYIYNPNPKNGHYLLIFPPGKNYDVIVEAEGYLTQNINVYIPDQALFYELFQEIRLKPLISLGKKVGEKLEVDNMFFAEGHPVDTAPELEKDYSALFKIVESIIEGTDSLDQLTIEMRGLSSEKNEENTQSYDQLFGLLDKAFEEGSLEIMNRVQEDASIPDRYSQVYFYNADTNLKDLQKIIIGKDTLLTKPGLTAYGQRDLQLIYSNDLIDTTYFSLDFETEKVDTLEYKESKKVVITPAMLRKSAPENRKTVISHYIYFDIGSTDLPGNIENELDEIARLLVNNSQLGLVVYGFADKTGDEQSNAELSNRRAFTMLEKLRSMGVNPERSIVKGFGEDRAMHSGTEMGKDRRVEIYVYELINPTP